MAACMKRRLWRLLLLLDVAWSSESCLPNAIALKDRANISIDDAGLLLRNLNEATILWGDIVKNTVPPV